jgi:hypothetical protein
MKTHEGVDIQFQAFLTQALNRGEWLISGPGQFSIGEGAQRISFPRRLGEHQAGLNEMVKRKKLFLIEN